MKRTLLLLLITNLAVLSSFAQTKLVSLKEALALCAKNNRDLQTAALKTKTDAQNVYAAWSAMGPQVKAFSTFDNNFFLPTQLIPAQIFGGPAGTFQKVQFGTTFNCTGGLEANMPLINTSSWFDVQLVQLTKKISENTLNVRTMELNKALTRVYYSGLLSREYYDITKKNFAVADSLYRSAIEKNKNGLLDPLDFNRIKTNFLSVSSQLDESKSILAKNTNNLKLLIGMKQEDSLIFEEKMSAEIKIGVLLAPSLDKEPTLLNYKLQVKLAKTALIKDNLKRLPELSLYSRYFKQALRNDPSVFDKSQNWFEVGLVGVRLDLPLFTGFARQSQINKSKIKLRIAQLELENETEKLKAENNELLLNVQQSMNSLKNSSAALALSEQSNRIALEKYTQGIYSLDQYLNVFNESLNTQRQYLKNFGDYFVSQSILELKK